MKYKDLVKFIHLTQVNTGIYFPLNNESEDDTYVLKYQTHINKWICYYTERGRKEGYNCFKTEDEACDYMYFIALTSITNQYNRENIVSRIY